MDNMTAYINRKSGEIVTVSDDDMLLVEEEEEVDAEDLPDWPAAMLPKLREIADGEDWAALPSTFDIHAWEIMRKFSDRVDDDALAARLSRGIHGKGAFRMFRATIEDAGRLDDWYAFKNEALREIAKAALDELRIPYR